MIFLGHCIQNINHITDAFLEYRHSLGIAFCLILWLRQIVGQFPTYPRELS